MLAVLVSPVEAISMDKQVAMDVGWMYPALARTIRLLEWHARLSNALRKWCVCHVLNVTYSTIQEFAVYVRCLPSCHCS